MRDLLKILVLPPVALFVAMAAGFYLQRRKHRAGVPLMVTGFGLLVMLSLPITASGLMSAAQWGVKPLHLTSDMKPEAIVILSAGLDETAPEFGGKVSVDNATLMRLRYGARLHRTAHLPVLVTGGPWGRSQSILADAMADSLATDFQVKTRWVERQALTTRGNAEHSADILLEADIHTVLLVTHAFHMPRARRAFERAGLEVIAAPTGFERSPGFTPSALVPQAWALHNSYYALHEVFGRAWYAITS